MRTRLPALILGIFLTALMAQDAGAGMATPFPSIPKAIAEPGFHGDTPIRKNHMFLLLHQRDETMHKGLRPEKDGLKGCLSCHVVYDASGQAISYEDSVHFCRVCHDYAAVQVDCFECHSSLPTPSIQADIAEEGAGQ